MISRMHDIQGGVAVITGAATSVGRFTTLAFAEAGCGQIHLGDTSLDDVQAVREDIEKQYPSTSVHVYAFDRSSEVSVNSFIQEVANTTGRIDFAINVVCQPQPSTMPIGHDIEQFDKDFKLYQRGAFLIQRALLRQLLLQPISTPSSTRGSIVNIIPYAPTPSLVDIPITAQIANAIIGFSKTDACDYAADSIRVNCVAAGEVMLTKTRPELAGGVPLPRKGETEDVANAALWLSLPGSGWLTGLVVPVDGGRGLHHWW